MRSEIFPGALAGALVVFCSGLFIVVGNAFGRPGSFLPAIWPVVRFASRLLASWEMLFGLLHGSLLTIFSLANSSGVICAFSATCANKSQDFAF